MKHATVNKNNKMLGTARTLRRNLTPQEHKLWYVFLRDYPVKIYKQRIIESFVVDFYCAQARLVIELDGSQHYTEQGRAYDAERSTVLEQYGLLVLRFANNDVDNHLMPSVRRFTAPFSTGFHLKTNRKGTNSHDHLHQKRDSEGRTGKDR